MKSRVYFFNLRGPMKLRELSSNLLRFYYDFFVLTSATVVTFLFLKYVGLELSIFPLMLSPIIVMGISYLFGIYSFNKLSSGLKKVSLLLLSTVMALIVLWVLGQTLVSVVLFGILSIPLITLPRYFLNLNKTSGRMISRVLNDKGVVLVVGGAGYIGTHVVDVLLNSNYKVRVLDKLMYNKATIKDFEKNPNFEFIEGDATDISRLVTAMNGASSVVHLAGLVGDPACAVDKDFTRHTNVISTRMVKDVALSAGVSRFIFASSCSVYGANDNVVNESSSLNPVSLYALTKIDSEKELFNTINDDFHVTILRFATVFGHSRRPRFDLVGNLFSAQAFNDGKLTVVGPNQWRPFVHCRDLARAIEAVLKAPVSKVHGQIFNVGDDSLNMTIGSLAEKVAATAKEFGKKSELIVSDNVLDKRNYKVSFKKIKTVLGFNSEYTIEKGVEEIMREFAKGTYGDYKDSAYSNLEMTKQQVGSFYDPTQTSNLYRPITDVNSSLNEA